MIANLLDIDEAMILKAAQGEEAMAFFYDFAAAFPSIEHELLHQFFRSLGWPEWVLRAVVILYLDNFCQICMGGSKFSGFNISRGIRQGCPLSPLLFAAATDLMLRRLHRRFPEACTRAWADDLAMVMQKGDGTMRELQDFLQDLSKISGLQLRTPKRR